MEDFCAFILTHNRVGNIDTLNSLERCGYTGKVYLVVDDLDPALSDYVSTYGEDMVLIFSKEEIAKKFDEYDNFGAEGRGAVVYARNACWELAESVGCRYFIQLDDDYTNFRYTFNEQFKYARDRRIKSLDTIFRDLKNYLADCPSILTIAIAQGGDFIGGGGNVRVSHIKLLRKAMNSFICDTQRPFMFSGRINEDVNTYVGDGSRGALILTANMYSLDQRQTQSNGGGMTDLYLDGGTYIKSFYTVIANPSSVTINSMGVTSRRLHHRVSWDNAVPKIVSEDLKKV